MKKSGYRTIFHIYLIFFLTLLGTILAAIALFFMLITVRLPDGSSVRSDWPKTFTEEFGEQIIFVDNLPQVKQSGIVLLQEHGVGFQLIDFSGYEVSSYQKPEQVGESYSATELLQLYQTGNFENGQVTAFFGTASDGEKDYIYILYFPMSISKVTMYLNGKNFAGGKTVFLPVFGILMTAVILSGALYGFLTVKAMKRLTTSIQDISLRCYLPMKEGGAFGDLYDSLNTLDELMKASDRLREQTEIMREQWISNITHDLRTPLSPIKGYAEILEENGGRDATECRRYAGIMRKSASYMETLIDDLKLTYQLQSGMIPIHREQQNLVRFLKELMIDILNSPEYENRIAHFESESELVLFSFDKTLLTRAFRNLIINSFVHGKEDTEITLKVLTVDGCIQIEVADNGKGMKQEEIEHLFNRYYRGTSTEQKPEGTGLGLAIVKSVIDIHGGTISAFSVPGAGTSFQMNFPIVKVN